MVKERMASYYLSYDTENDFYKDLLTNKNPNLIKKIVKCVLSAHKRKKKEIEIFEVTFKNQQLIMPYKITQINYLKCLSRHLDGMIHLEEYELCAQMRDAIIQLTKKPKK